MFVSFGSSENVSVSVFKLECVKTGFVVASIGLSKHDKHSNSSEYFKVEEECFAVPVDQGTLSIYFHGLFKIFF